MCMQGRLKHECNGWTTLLLQKFFQCLATRTHTFTLETFSDRTDLLGMLQLHSDLHRRVMSPSLSPSPPSSLPSLFPSLSPPSSPLFLPSQHTCTQLVIWVCLYESIQTTWTTHAQPTEHWQWTSVVFLKGMWLTPFTENVYPQLWSGLPPCWASQGWEGGRENKV